MIDRARELALKVLYDIDTKGAYSHIALDSTLKRARSYPGGFNINERDVGFISELVYGTVSWRLTIDEIIKKYTKIKIKKISPWILNILRMSIYQILFLTKVPKSAAVNEGVNLAKRYGHKASSNFVNAVLRKVKMKDYEEFFAINDEVERIAKTTSMPVWLVEELLKQNPAETVEKICQVSHQKPKLQVRVNRLKTNGELLEKELQKQGVQTQKAHMDDFLVLEGAKNIENLDGFRQGMFTVQDEAGGLIPKILHPMPKEKVLDACSSPGGKTTYMAELMHNQGEIKAWDLHEHRVDLVKQLAKILCITKIDAAVKDATVYDGAYVGYFDKILLDVPCLGFGVLKRKPDIKWKKTQQDKEEIQKIQEAILENCSAYLKDGGEIVYSTCSILKEENEQVIQHFLEKHPEFDIQKIQRKDYDENLFWDKFLDKNGFLQVFQNEETDGFFMAKMKKKKAER